MSKNKPAKKVSKAATKKKAAPTPPARSASSPAAIPTFCRQVRSRSAELGQGIDILQGAQLYGVIVGLLRQELDSLVRVIYLLHQTPARREELAEASMDGKLWSHPNGKRITDREMVELADNLQGWTRSVYRFGCAFIHLSNGHDYLARDPFVLLPQQEQLDILQHMRHYHGGPAPGCAVTFRELVPYLPFVFDKIASNLEGYVQTLEKGGTI